MEIQTSTNRKRDTWTMRLLKWMDFHNNSKELFHWRKSLNLQCHSILNSCLQFRCSTLQDLC